MLRCGTMTNTQSSQHSALIATAVALGATAIWWAVTSPQVEALLCRCGVRDPTALSQQRRRRAAAQSSCQHRKIRNDTAILVDKNVEPWVQKYLQLPQVMTLLAIEHCDEELYARVAVGEEHHYLVLLVPFCRSLQAEWDRSVHTYTFCVVADASGGQAQGVIEQILDLKTEGATPIPVWLLQWATELDTLSRSTRRTILQALCRLHAQAMVKTGTSVSVVPLVLPLGLVPHVWPELTEIFPHDRRVFMYTSCAEATSRGLVTTTKATTKLADSPFLTSARQLHSTLAALPWRHAVAVEDWMSAIDTLLREQDERIESLKRKTTTEPSSTPPFICCIDYLRRDDDDDIDSAFYARRALYQYMTGDRRLDATIPPVALEDRVPSCTPPILALLSRAAFLHHRILLPHKTLPDTVAPVEHWGLQQAVKGGGCACCGPEDDEEDEEDDENKEPTSSNNFVDGKMSFAFDPTRFAT